MDGALAVDTVPAPLGDGLEHMANVGWLEQQDRDGTLVSVCRLYTTSVTLVALQQRRHEVQAVKRGAEAPHLVHADTD